MRLGCGADATLRTAVIVSRLSVAPAHAAFVGVPGGERGIDLAARALHGRSLEESRSEPSEATAFLLRDYLATSATGTESGGAPSWLSAAEGLSGSRPGAAHRDRGAARHRRPQAPSALKSRHRVRSLAARRPESTGSLQAAPSVRANDPARSWCRAPLRRPARRCPDAPTRWRPERASAPWRSPR
mgnify:FL=1